MPKINVSFKNTTRDMKLFATANSEEEKSDVMKDALEFYLKYKDMEYLLIDILNQKEKSK